MRDETVCKCPFYQSVKGERLVCQGIILGTRITTTWFPSTRKRMEWQWQYCNTWNYTKCPYYRIAERNMYERPG